MPGVGSKQGRDLRDGGAAGRDAYAASIAPARALLAPAPGPASLPRRGAPLGIIRTPGTASARPGQPPHLHAGVPALASEDSVGRRGGRAAAGCRTGARPPRCVRLHSDAAEARRGGPLLLIAQCAAASRDSRPGREEPRASRRHQPLQPCRPRPAAPDARGIARSRRGAARHGRVASRVSCCPPARCQPNTHLQRARSTPAPPPRTVSGAVTVSQQASQPAAHLDAIPKHQGARDSRRPVRPCRPPADAPSRPRRPGPSPARGERRQEETQRGRPARQRPQEGTAWPGASGRRGSGASGRRGGGGAGVQGDAVARAEPLAGRPAPGRGCRAREREFTAMLERG
jgi:hypothetical protein